MKTKAESDDIESLHNFINELYDKLAELASTSAAANGTEIQLPQLT
jgi:hypothetical protein